MAPKDEKTGGRTLKMGLAAVSAIMTGARTASWSCM